MEKIKILGLSAPNPDKGFTLDPFNSFDFVEAIKYFWASFFKKLAGNCGIPQWAEPMVSIF